MSQSVHPLVVAILHSLVNWFVAAASAAMSISAVLPNSGVTASNAASATASFPVMAAIRLVSLFWGIVRDIIPNSCACLAACVCGIIVSTMTIKEIAGSIEYRSVVNDYRDTCLWFASNVLDPKDRAQLEQVLSSIETYGDADAYRRVGRIRQWL